MYKSSNVSEDIFCHLSLYNNNNNNNGDDDDDEDDDDDAVVCRTKVAGYLLSH